MAAKKEIAVLKRAKISEAQQYVLLAVLGAAIFLGVAVSLIMHFTKKISFNIEVIAEEERAIVAYSDTIKKIGVCQSPKGAVYTDEELAACNPDDIEVSAVPGTLRSEIVDGMAANKALNSVPKEDNTNCINPLSNKAYTYKEMQDFLNDATTTDARVAATQLIKNCSALRIIPDALPSTKNEEALLASVNKIFIISGWLPESISPAGDGGGGYGGEDGSSTTNLSQLSVSLSVEADVATTMNVLNNMERSIREFSFDSASIEWTPGALKLDSTATAFYTSKSELSETTKTISSGDSTSSSSTTGGSN